MSPRAVPCDSCGSPIADADLETGQAVTLLGKRYCPGCKTEAIQGVSLEDLSGGAPPPRKAAAPKPAPARAAAPKVEAAPSSPRVVRKPAVRAPAPTPSRTPLIAGAAAVVVLLVAGAAYLGLRSDSAPAPAGPASGKPSTPSGGPATAADPETRARAAYAKVQELAARPGTSWDLVLAAVDQARAACKGTSFEKSLEAIAQKAQRDKEGEEAARDLAPLIDELKGAVATDPEFKRYSELQPKFRLAIETGAKSGSTRVNEIRSLLNDYNSRYEKLAEPYYTEIHEAATALADERRYDDAIRKIETFPQQFRNSGSWTTLQKLRQDIERRKKK
ncbi:MAG: hypothetical protein JO332_03690 [Planctomycetaceae bacterium]|nr:hypothetical protein [Planctomycetaceae bacterium]